MPVTPYGETIWGPEARQSETGFAGVALPMAVVGGVAAGGLWATTRRRADDGSYIDAPWKAVRYAGNMSPGQLLHTFRVPEAVSAFVSPRAQGMERKGRVWSKSWGKEFLEYDETYDWLKAVTGLDDAGMEVRGLRSGGFGDAKSIVFERLAGEESTVAGRGKLWSIVERDGKTERKLLSDSIQLMEALPESPTIVNPRRKVNKALKSVAQALGIFDEVDDFNLNNVFRGKESLKPDGELKAGKGSQFVPVPSIEGQAETSGDLWRRSTLLRAPGAFGMERFNELMRTAVEQVPVVGPAAEKSLKQLGQDLTVKSGTGTRMFFRFGGKAATVGGVAMGIGQMDWLRREYGTPGHLAAATGTSAGLSYLTSRFTGSGRASIMVGAASFFGQTVLPGFDEGILQGLATTWAKTTEARARYSPFNIQARITEGFLPGVGDWEVGLLGGIGVAGASALGARKMFEAGIHKKLGIPDNVIMDIDGSQVRRKVGPPESLISVYKRRVGDRAFDEALDKLSSEDGRLSPDAKKQLSGLRKTIEKGGARGRFERRIKKDLGELGVNYGEEEWLDLINEEFEKATGEAATGRRYNTVTQALGNKLDDITRRTAGDTLKGKASRFAQSSWAKFVYSFMGADPSKIGGKLGRWGTLVGGTVAAHGLLTGGILGTTDDPDELRAIYSGDKQVPIRSGRYWESGGLPYGGDQAAFYYRPHWYPTLMSRANQKAVWKEKDSYSPIRKFLTKNFTYELERDHYYDRPHPISMPAFADVPIIGGFLSSTVGRLIKPAKLMHVDAWARDAPGGDGGEFAHVSGGARQEPDYELGAELPATPMSPYAPSAVASDAMYQAHELSGLVGWAASTFREVVTGEERIAPYNRPMLSSSQEIHSTRGAFWDMALGGMGFLSEPIRRFLPAERGDKEKYNPIPNTGMPSWLPSKFHVGDPTSRLEMGETRLPGPGFEALHPELRGRDPEDYPLGYRYQILGDVAPHSREFRATRKQLYSKRMSGQTSEHENQLIDKVDKQVAAKLRGHEPPTPDDTAIQLPGSSVTQGLWRTAQRTLRETAAPAEYMTPMGFRPVQKLLGERGPMEQYEHERLYGTPLAFWDKPWRDWFRPATYSLASFMGFDGKPAWRQEADAVNAQFDQMKFYKWMKAAQEAEAAGNTNEAAKFRARAQDTRYGVNPDGDIEDIYWTLPKEEREFFNAFASASGPERQRIREMIPNDQVHLYEAIWKRLDKQGSVRRSSDDEWANAQLQKLDASDMPREDWLGYREQYQIDDIKVKYLDTLGRDMADYGHWEAELARAERQPGIQQAASQVDAPRGYMQSLVHNQLGAPGKRQQAHAWQGRLGQNTELTYNDDRILEIQEELSGFGY